VEVTGQRFATEFRRLAEIADSLFEPALLLVEQAQDEIRESDVRVLKRNARGIFLPFTGITVRASFIESPEEIAAHALRFGAPPLPVIDSGEEDQRVPAIRKETDLPLRVFFRPIKLILLEI
jgi:hypothetical protein